METVPKFHEVENLFTQTDVSLNIPVNKTFVRVATTFVENSVMAFDLPSDTALALTLATEEIFLHMGDVTHIEKELTIRCILKSYYVRVDFLFEADDPDLGAFNLVNRTAVKEGKLSPQMGLMLASRSVDRFFIEREEGKKLKLSLIKEKPYPLLKGESTIPVQPLSDYSVRTPDPSELKLLSMLICQTNPGELLPEFFSYPGKVVDMESGGYLGAAVAVSPSGVLGGGILWRWITPKTVECLGPYLFGQSEDTAMGEGLLEACLGSLARTACVGVISRFPTRTPLERYFETIGELSIWRGQGHMTDLEVHYRAMHEDPGSRIWCHDAVRSFVEEQYERLSLPRTLTEVMDAGETWPRDSLLATDFRFLKRHAILTPLLAGSDIRQNLSEHIRILEREGIGAIFFDMDLTDAKNAVWTPALLEAGFSPKLILPYALKGDLLIFERVVRAAS